jgi:catechol 2,3-dioxygenase-like lactoylglutathione lyase family enzyme
MPIRAAPTRSSFSRGSSPTRHNRGSPTEHVEDAMPATAMNHFTILTDDVPATVRFYGELLGLPEGPRPPLQFPGAWLYAGGNPILHVVGGRVAGELKPGVIDHMAFSATGLSDTLALLTSRNIEHVCRRQAGSGTWQLFFHDPNGARVELDFAADEPHHARDAAVR